MTMQSPAVCAGAVQVISVALTTVTPVQATAVLATLPDARLRPTMVVTTAPVVMRRMDVPRPSVT